VRSCENKTKQNRFTCEHFTSKLKQFSLHSFFHWCTEILAAVLNKKSPNFSNYVGLLHKSLWGTSMCASNVAYRVQMSNAWFMRQPLGKINIPTRDERNHIFQTPTSLLLLALRILLLIRLWKIWNINSDSSLHSENFQVTHIKSSVYLPHEAKYTPWLFCFWSNTN